MAGAGCLASFLPKTRAGVKPSVSFNSRWQKLFLPRIDADGHDRLPKRLFSPALMPLPTHWTSLEYSLLPCEQQRQNGRVIEASCHWPGIL